ncbi:hypothetical protein [Thermosinus carboxydivorans]|uniref:hypothetical protein n=1 Tax=Thermosinus carboxydivorans TaxID=261685 RepID=UPI0002FDFB12|nr:hypothetical protein [Thermosinus carboxydivorans]
MSAIELILLMVVAGLAAQVVILQRHYEERLSDQAMVLNCLFELLRGKTLRPEQLEDVRNKIFSSSQ